MMPFIDNDHDQHVLERTCQNCGFVMRWANAQARHITRDWGKHVCAKDTGSQAAAALHSSGASTLERRKSPQPPDASIHSFYV